MRQADREGRAMDTTAAYRGVRERICELAEGADGDLAVPACPGWTVRDLLAHLTGVGDDLLNGRLDGVGTDPWTEAQVARRRDASLEEVVAEWQGIAGALDEALDAIGGAPEQLVFDTATHEHDLRQALDRPGARDSDAVAIGLGWVLPRWQEASSGGAGPLRLVAGDHDVTAGDGEAIATVELEPFEAVRALTGRRSATQLASYAWTGDPAAFVDRFTWGPFTLRTSPLDE
jgi:uncharacterized protein (TIGR03083 family)